MKRQLLRTLCLIILVFSLLLTISACEETEIIQHVYTFRFSTQKKFRSKSGYPDSVLVKNPTII